MVARTRLIVTLYYFACIVGYEMEVFVMTDDIERKEKCKYRRAWRL